MLSVSSMTSAPMSDTTDLVDADKSGKKRRKRITLVCNSCRKRKIKCDKKNPCSQCVKSGLSEQCEFAPVSDLVSNNGSGIMRLLLNDVGQDHDQDQHSEDSRKRRKKSEEFIPVSSTSNIPFLGQPAGLSGSSSKFSVNGGNYESHSESIDAADSVTIEEFLRLKERLSQIESAMLKNAHNKGGQDKPTEVIPSPESSTTSRSTAQMAESIHSKSQSSLNGTPLFSPASSNSRVDSQSNTSPIDNAKEYRPVSLVRREQQRFLQLRVQEQKKVQSERPKIEGFACGMFSTSTTTPISRPNEYHGINPYVDDDETIDFYKGYTSLHINEKFRRMNLGPFAWASLMKKDTALNEIWNYVMVQRKSNANGNGLDSTEIHLLAKPVMNYTPEKGTAISMPKNLTTEGVFKFKAMESDGYEEMIPYNALIERRKEYKKDQDSDLRKQALNKLTPKTVNSNHLTKDELLPLGLTFCEWKFDRELQLIDRIKNELPKRQIIWKLVERFFTYLYPFFPFLDEKTFYAEISRIVGPISMKYEDVPYMKAEKRIDLAYLGILLLILRLSYLSLFFNRSKVNEANLYSTDPSPEAQDRKLLLNNPINIDAANVAESCLFQFPFLKKAHLTVLQLALYYRIYKTYAPEEGDGIDGDSQVLNSLLVNMAYSIGLNRDPDNFSDALNDPKQNHLCRKIWYFLVLLDIYGSFGFGNPMVIDKRFYDTKVPFYELGSENISNAILDRTVTESFMSCGTLFPVVQKLLFTILDMNNPPKMKDVCEQLNYIEDMMVDHQFSLRECLKPLEVQDHSYFFLRTFRAKFYIALKSFFFSVYYHFFLHYEKTNIEFSYYYLRKLFVLSIDQTMPYYFELLANSDIICDMIMNPSLEALIHKSNQFNVACIIRINSLIHYLSVQPTHIKSFYTDPNYKFYYKTLVKLSSCLTRCAEVAVAAVSKICNRYYYAWRITKGQLFMLKIITLKEFYSNYEASGRQFTFRDYSLDQLEELITICEKTLNKLGKDKNTEEFKFYDIGVPNESRERESRNSSIASPGMNIGMMLNGIPSNFQSTATPNMSDVTAEPIFGSDMLPPESVPSNLDSTTGGVPSAADITPDSLAQQAGEGSARDKNDATYDFGIGLENTQEIDKLWLQMLSMKNENQARNADSGGDGSDQFPDFANGSNSGQDATQNSFIGSPFNWMANSPMGEYSSGAGGPEEVGKIDFFSLIPFEEFT